MKKKKINQIKFYLEIGDIVMLKLLFENFFVRKKVIENIELMIVFKLNQKCIVV